MSSTTQPQRRTRPPMRAQASPCCSRSSPSPARPWPGSCPLGGLWIGVPLAVAAIVLGARARRQDARPAMATAAIVLAVLVIAQLAFWFGLSMVS